jgi:threonyl-tRNA synthetase
MADDEQQDIPIDEAAGLEAPERGSATELMDHGASGELGRCATVAAHVLAEAVLDLFPGTKLGIGPVIDDGFYYDFLLPRPLTPDDLPRIEERMRASIAADHPFELSEETPDLARARLAEQGQDFKVEIIDDLLATSKRDGTAMPPHDLLSARPVHRSVPRPACREHRQDRPRSSCSAPPAAYWRGDEKRPMLQRVYGTAWATQEELDAYLWRRDEARKRDHRRLGPQLDLFSFHDVSPGAAFWHPKGQLIWRTLEGAMRELQVRRGYQEVSTPIVVSERLWRQSGHWDLYRDNMFLVESENQTFSLKPMNCPESTFIYRSHLRSYRELPLRFSEFGRLHRNERFRDAVGADPRSPVHPGRRASLCPTGPADRRDRRAARRGPRARTAGSGSSRGSRSRRSRTRRSATRRSGSGPSSSPAKRSRRPTSATS